MVFVVYRANEGTKNFGVYCVTAKPLDTFEFRQRLSTECCCWHDVSYLLWRGIHTQSQA